MLSTKVFAAVCLFLGAATAQVQNSQVIGYSDSACADVVHESEIDFGDNRDCVDFDLTVFNSVRVAGGNPTAPTDCTIQLWSTNLCSGTLTPIGPVNTIDFSDCIAVSSVQSFNTVNCD